MSGKQRYLMAGGTFACALGIGFVMQNGDALAARFGGDAPSEQPVQQTAEFEIQQGVAQVQTAGMTGGAIPSAAAIIVPAATATVSGALPEMPSDLASPDVPEAEIVLTAAPADMPLAPEDDIAGETILNDRCAPLMLAETAPAAMVEVSLSATCLPNERVTIHHNGMMFTDITGADGALSLTIPAMNENAVFIASFSNGEGAMVTTDVPTLKFYDRVAVQWKDTDGFELHAREFGADYGDEGHVWHQSTRDVAFVADGNGGFLTRLGNTAAPSPLMAEIYTFPSAAIARDGDIRLTVETEVTAANCGREVAAQSLQLRKDAPVFVQDVTLEMPACDAVGDFLVLKNMLEDLTIAQK